MLISRALTTPSSGPGISPARIGRSLSFRRAAAVQARKRISGMFAVQGDSRPTEQVRQELAARHPDLPAPPGAALETLADLLAFYAFHGDTDRLAQLSAGADSQRSAQPGGGLPQPQTSAPHLDTPEQVTENQYSDTVPGYREAARSHGIPFRPAGLFELGDSLLAELGGDSAAFPFEKLLAGTEGCNQPLPRGGWATGNAAAAHGVDLRMFYKAPQEGTEWGTLTAAARLSEKASIGNGFWKTAHGGAIETLLDETTAELAKMHLSPILATTEIAFKLRRPVPLNSTLRIECKISRITGMRCWIAGSILDPAGTLLASCEAQVVDLRPLREFQGLQKRA